jgi:serine/threonine protein kinase
VFMVMELLAGETLAARLEREGPLPLDETLAVMAPVASALRAAHARGIVHRDLKPENIFLARSEGSDAIDVKVLDFGLAKPVSSTAGTTAITQTGAVMGTPYYMAPEQVYGEKDLDPRADVWALGAVLYECLGGEKPFTGENFGQVFRRISQAEFRPLRELAPGVPGWLADLVAQMLSHEREPRPSMSSVYDRLSSRPVADARARLTRPMAPQPTVRLALPSSGAEARPARPPELPAATHVATSASVRSPATTAWRRPWGLVAGGVFALVAVVVGATIARRPASPSSVAPVDVEALPATASTAPWPPAPPSAPPSSVEPPASASASEAPGSPPPAASAPLPKRGHPAGPPARDPLARGRF